MKLLFKDANVYSHGKLFAADVLVEEDKITQVGDISPADAHRVVYAKGMVLSPAFVDLHVHLRQPGFEQKETIQSGTAAAAAGGFGCVCSMPNLSPVPHDTAALNVQLDAIQKDALVQVLPYGAITVDEKGETLSDIAALATLVVGFSDDGRGVQSEEMMRTAMRQVADAGSFIAAHCEVDSLLPKSGICVQEDSDFARKHGFNGHSNESEWKEVERDIRLSEETGCPLHICHASTAKTFELVRSAQKKGLRVSCEVAPHHLLLSCDDITENDSRFQMNPPLRTPQDVAAAVAALADGTACCVATDHAPHTQKEKQCGFEKGANGIVGLQTAFASLYTGLVLRGKISLETLLQRMTEGLSCVKKTAPAHIAPGQDATLVLLNLDTPYTVDSQKFKGMGRSTPFEGKTLRGQVQLALQKGRIVHENM